MGNKNRQFPIQGETPKQQKTYIPWWLAEIAYEYYSERFGNDQSLERIAERGGFGRRELVWFIRKELPHT